MYTHAHTLLTLLHCSTITISSLITMVTVYNGTECYTMVSSHSQCRYCRSSTTSCSKYYPLHDMERSAIAPCMLLVLLYFTPSLNSAGQCHRQILPSTRHVTVSYCSMHAPCIAIFYSFSKFCRSMPSANSTLHMTCNGQLLLHACSLYCYILLLL